MAEQLRRVERRTRQLEILRAEERQSHARITRLGDVLDVDRVASHLDDAVAQAPVQGVPVPHVVVVNLFPADVYDALVGALPASVFFEPLPGQPGELRVPIRFAPSHSIVAWTFVNDVVLRTLSALLLSRFAQPITAYAKAAFPAFPSFEQWDVEVTLSQGRLVRRTGGSESVPSVRPWDLLTGVVDLARSGDSGDFGSLLRPPVDSAAGEQVVPFRANALLAFVGPSSAHAYAPIPAAAGPGTERYTYEFGVGPTREGRRVLLRRFPHARPADG